jgi:hypothetical protein
MTTYLAENLQAMKEEAYVNNIDNYTSSISHELSMTRFPKSSMSCMLHRLAIGYKKNL